MCWHVRGMLGLTLILTKAKAVEAEAQARARVAVETEGAGKAVGCVGWAEAGAGEMEECSAVEGEATVDLAAVVAEAAAGLATWRSCRI